MNVLLISKNEGLLDVLQEYFTILQDEIVICRHSGPAWRKCYRQAFPLVVIDTYDHGHMELLDNLHKHPFRQKIAVFALVAKKLKKKLPKIIDSGIDDYWIIDYSKGWQEFLWSRLRVIHSRIKKQSQEEEYIDTDDPLETILEYSGQLMTTRELDVKYKQWAEKIFRCAREIAVAEKSRKNILPEVHNIVDTSKEQKIAHKISQKVVKYHCPPLDELMVLYEYADIGNLREIQRKLDELQENERYGPFISELRYYSRRFQIRRVRHFLMEHMKYLHESSSVY